MKFTKPQDIVFVLPPHRLKEARYSLGPLYLASYLRQAGYESLITDNKLLGDEKPYEHISVEKSRNDILDKVIKLQPKILAYSANTTEINEIIGMHNILREKVNAISIIGGAHATADPQGMLKRDFDIVAIGEGEMTAVELIKELDQDQPDLSKIEGIAWKNKVGEIIINSSRPAMDISDILLPAYDKIDVARVLKMSDQVIRGVPLKTAMLMTSRGCPYSCTFCACNKVFGRQVRYRSYENIKEEIKFFKKHYNLEAIWFADDTMTVNYDHVRKICRLMKEEKLYWGAQARVNLADEEIIKLMKDSNCLQLDFGVESGSQRVLDEIINKKITLKQVEETFANCRKYGIRAHAAFMLGLPTETREEVYQTLKFARKLKPNFYAFGMFTPLPGTYLYEYYYQPGEITLDDYRGITFHKSTDKFNRSQVNDLNEIFSQWRKRLFEGIKWRNLSHPLIYIKLFFILPNKLERFDFLFFKFRRLIKYLLNKIGFSFSLVGRN